MNTTEASTARDYKTSKKAEMENEIELSEKWGDSLLVINNYIGTEEFNINQSII